MWDDGTADGGDVVNAEEIRITVNIAPAMVALRDMKKELREVAGETKKLHRLIWKTMHMKDGMFAFIRAWLKDGSR
jgi:hypothetical protein